MRDGDVDGSADGRMELLSDGLLERITDGSLERMPDGRTEGLCVRGQRCYFSRERVDAYHHQ